MVVVDMIPYRIPDLVFRDTEIGDQEIFCVVCGRKLGREGYFSEVYGGCEHFYWRPYSIYEPQYYEAKRHKEAILIIPEPSGIHWFLIRRI